MQLEDTLERVREFHLAFDHPIAPLVTVPEPKTRLLRFRLLLEEVMEFGRAVGVRGLADISEAEFAEIVREIRSESTMAEDAKVDLVEAADALADIDYVTAGANLAFGFPARKVAAEVHRSNMSKLGADGRPMFGVGGRVAKGPNYTPPDIWGVLASHGFADDAP